MPDEFGGVEVPTDEFGGVAVDQEPSRDFRRDELAKQTFEARLEGERGKLYSALADIGGNAAYWTADALAKVDPTGIANQMLARQEVPRTPPILAPEDIGTIGEVVKRGLHIPETAPAEGKLGEVTRGLSEAGKEMAVGFSDPGMISGLALGKALPQEAARLFQLQMLGALPSTTQQAIQAQNLEEAVKGGAGVIGNVAFPIMLGEHAVGPTPKVPDRIGSQMELQRGAVPPRGEPAAPIERATPEQAAATAETLAPVESPTTPAPEKTEVKPNVQAPQKLSNQKVSSIWNNLLESSRDDLNELLMNWQDAQLSEDGSKIVGTIGRDKNDKVVVSKKQFLNWLHSDDPFNPKSFAQDPDWVDLVNRVRGKTGLEPSKEVATPSPVPETGKAVEQPPTPLEMVGMGEKKITQGPGARTATTDETPESIEGTGLKNAIGEVERVSYGLPEATPTQRRAMGAAWLKSAKILEDNPKAGELLVSKLRNDPHMGLTDEDSAVLLRHKVDIENAMNSAAERTNAAEDPAVKKNAQAEYQLLSDQLLELLDMAKARGSQWGREGRWRQAIANQDYSLATMESRMRASLGGRRLTDAEHAQLLKDYEAEKATNKAWQEHLEKREAEIEELQLKLAEEKAARAEAGEQPAVHPTILKLAEDYAKKWDDRGKQALADLKALFGGGDNPMFAGAPITPEMLDKAIIYGTSKIVRGAVDFAKWSDEMVRDLGPGFVKHAKAVWEASKKAFESDVAKAFKNKSPTVKRALKEPTSAELGEKIATAVRDRLDKKELNAIPGYLQKLARSLWKEGVRDRDSMVDRLHSIISTKVPDLTKREVSRMWSGYGDYRQLSKEEIDVGLRKIKGELLETAKLEDMAEGRPPLKSGHERGEVSEARRQLIKKVNDAKYQFQVPIEDPNTQLKSALDTYKTILKNRSADLEDRLARGDFSPRPRRELILDEQAMKLKAENQRVRNRYEAALEKNRLANRKPWQKLLDNFVKWERAFKLSSPVVFGKLGAAAGTRLVTTAAEEAVGSVLSKIPGISKIAEQAPREGGASIQAMAKGLAGMISKGIQDAKQTAKSGMTDLDIILGKEGGLDKEWVNLFGQLHGMMKAPIKRFEYELSLQKRIEHAMENGEDVRNPQVTMRLMTEAMNDGYRSIFMQRGFSADLFNTALHMAETSKKYQPQGEIVSRIARFLLPIVRVPINIFSETATGITGVPVASTRLMLHAIRGELGNMDPKIADSIMRQFKKGSIGAGLMAIGFMNPQAVGGYNWREKRGPNEAKTAGFRVGGTDIPRWATHAPWFELMQFGATLRHAADNRKQGLGEGALLASVGLLEQTPFYGEAMRVVQAGESGKRFGQFTGELAGSTLVPQAVQKTAELLDEEKKGYRRTPRNVLEHVTVRIPGLRQNVPYKKSKVAQ